MMVSLQFTLPNASLVSDIPDEHARLVIHDNQVRTPGDIAFANPNRYFPMISVDLPPEARHRMFDKMRAIDPQRSWQSPWCPW